MKRLLNIYNRAEMVATLWMLSPLFPFLMFMKSDQAQWMPWVGSAIFIIVGVSISNYRKQQKEKNEWGVSDLIAYILIPSALFSFFTFIILNPG